MILLGIESSCDETSVAIVREGAILATVVSSQTTTHVEYGGVVPELATREHLRNLMPAARGALSEAGIHARQLNAIAATQGPGLPNALMAGFQAGQALAYRLGKPFIGIHHHEAHLYSPWISKNRADFDAFEPNISLIVSGGHTLLVHVQGELKHHVLGSTVDDAAGECFDKTAKLIGLPYPGGPEMDRLARGGNAKAIAFPRPMLNDATDDFSFSGLKTAVRYQIRDHPEWLLSTDLIRDLCASIQAAIIETLVTKTVRAARRLKISAVTASGGVSCNSGLRSALAGECSRHGLRLRVAEPMFCTDNAAMIAALAERKILRGWQPTPLDATVKPSWPLAEIHP